jgi:succinate dehydrogenase / fumarate reductase, membrane anchor subunit
MKLKWQADQFKNPMARAKGLGVGHAGSHHWMMQKLTALSNLFLLSWAVLSVIGLVGVDYGSFIDWLAQPVHAVLMILFLISVFTHMALGLQVVIEDYIHCELSKVVGIMMVKILCFSLAIAGIFSVLKIAL